MSQWNVAFWVTTQATYFAYTLFAFFGIVLRALELFVLNLVGHSWQ